ncbi:MAG: Gfo/Idh/MocA family protein [Planctomycetota bacterium]|jgi:predicted dehydrogenase
MSTNVTRRQFIETAGLTLGTALTGARAAGANEKPNVALIGAGGMGTNNLRFMMGTGRVNAVAVCDVDDNQAARAAKMVENNQKTKPKVTRDYREILDSKDVDLVIIGTPDHWHAIQMLNACAAKKDIYCEKPCSHNIREAQIMIKAAEKYGRVVQIGTYQRSMDHIKEARDFIREGKLGQISMTRTFIYDNEAPDGMGDNPDEPTPTNVDYDMWLGPAPVRPYNRRRFHKSWRWYFDYAAGMVGDWNVHLQDITMWSMESPYPTAVSASGGHYILKDDRDTPDTMQVSYEFPPCKNAPKGYVQTFCMRKASGKPWNRGGYGMEFYGTNGYLFVNRTDWKVEGDEVNWKNKKDKTLRTESLAKNNPLSTPAKYRQHMTDFLDCVCSRKKPIATIDNHYYTVVACHLANVSYRVGRKIFWDQQKELCFKDRKLTIPDDQANALLTREYRKGYQLPEV